MRSGGFGSIEWPDAMRNLMKTFPAGSLVTLAAASLLLAGCGQEVHVHSQASGGHKHASPHGGVAVELGDHQFHLDFLHDPAAGTLTAWVMDAHAENFVRVALPALNVQVATDSQTNALALLPVANLSTGETTNETSQFRAEAPWLKDLRRFNGLIDTVEIRGRKFSGIRFTYPAQ